MEVQNGGLFSVYVSFYASVPHYVRVVTLLYNMIHNTCQDLKEHIVQTVGSI